MLVLSQPSPEAEESVNRSCHPLAGCGEKWQAIKASPEPAPR